jgi:hypothetical protein
MEHGDRHPIKVAEVSWTRLASCGWDEFAIRCGASFRCARAAISAWQFDDHIRGRLRWFEIYCAESGEKIGQSAITFGRQQAAFVDGLQLLPESAALWEQSMRALLNELGSGQYRYGSHWSIEPPRVESLQNLAGVRVQEVQPFTVQAIDFSRWKSWDDYFRQISNNARRNARRASVQNPTLSVRVRRGLSTIADTHVLIRLQRVMASRKKLRLSLGKIILRFLFRSAFMQKYAVTAIVMVDSLALAAFSGIEFGQNTYYLSGGSDAGSGGAAWHLMLTMIRHAYDRTDGSGKFLMGCDHDISQGWTNLARSREQCRVTNFPTGIVTFDYG